MLRVLPTAAIAARMVVTGAVIVTRPRLLLQHQKQTNTKKEKTKERETSSQFLSSDSSDNSSFSEDSVEEGNSTKSHRFQIISKSECHKWELPREMADYVTHQFQCFIPEKDVQENLLIYYSLSLEYHGC